MFNGIFVKYLNVSSISFGLELILPFKIDQFKDI